MQSPFLPVESGFDLKGEARRLGVSVWRTPTFLMVLLGIVTGTLMLAIFVVLVDVASVEFLILLEAGIAICFLLLGGFAIHLVEEIALMHKLKDDFMTTASHKLKSPLAQIKWHIDAWQAKNPSRADDGTAEVFSRIESANDVLIRMVDELVYVTRFEGGAVRMYEESFSISELVREIFKKHASEAREKNIDFRVDPFEGDDGVLADRRRLGMVIDHLVVNALHYTPIAGSVVARIHKKNGAIRVCVEDTGIGVPPAYQDRIFEKFIRADNAIVTSEEGTGLGLYLCRSIMRQMRGEVWFEPRKEGGSVFCVTLPRKKK